MSYVMSGVGKRTRVWPGESCCQWALFRFVIRRYTAEMKYAVYLPLILLFIGGCSAADKPKTPPIELLPGNMDQWQSVNFGGEGDVFFNDGTLELDYGNPLTGVTYKGDLDELLGDSIENYAITMQAQRVEGVDMFLGVTFPVGNDGHVSLVLGGWAGAITGLSNLDGLNASENETTQYHAFEDKKWYKVKVLVTPKKIQCWLDDIQLVNIKRADYKTYDTHGAVVDTKPLGMFSYGTWGKVKDLKVWKLE